MLGGVGGRDEYITLLELLVSPRLVLSACFVFAGGFFIESAGLPLDSSEIVMKGLELVKN